MKIGEILLAASTIFAAVLLVELIWRLLFGEAA